MANSAFVTVALDVALNILAQRSIAVDAVMYNSRAEAGKGYSFAEACKPMAWMASSSIFNAFGAVIPVRTVQALVAYPKNVLYVFSVSSDPQTAGGEPFHIHHILQSGACRDQHYTELWL